MVLSKLIWNIYCNYTAAQSKTIEITLRAISIVMNNRLQASPENLLS